MRECEREFLNSMTNELNKDDVTPIAKNIDNMVNNFFFDYENLAEEIAGNECARKNMLCIITAWVKYLAVSFSNHNFDGRNQIACEKGNYISHLKEFDSYKDLTNFDFSEIVTDWNYKRFKNVDIPSLIICKLADMHRTLKQSFTRFCFYFMKISCGDINGEMSKTDTEWYLLPMI